MKRIYLAIDLKSFYASVECVDRGLDPLNTNLVVADESRTEKTICLAVSPSMKSYGIAGRARLFEAVQRVNELNAERLKKAGSFEGKSYIHSELNNNPKLKLDFIRAVPRMARYMQVSTQVFDIYCRFVSADDIHVYSVDEVFIDATDYLRIYRLSPREFAMTLIKAVLSETGVTATAGIGTNMYLAKIAMDIVAKHMPADENGVRIAELDEMSYRKELWAHRPLTDFWRIGNGYSAKLEANGMYTMGDVAEMSVTDEERLYRLFGINAELLIDHAWGWEPCTISEIKAYRPENNSLSLGQVLKTPYTAEKGRLIVREMTDSLVLDIAEKRLCTDQVVLTVCYDVENVNAGYRGEVSTDRYGRTAPKDAHGSKNLPSPTSSTRIITDAVTELYDRIVDKRLLVRRIYVVANHVIRECDAAERNVEEQIDLFTDYTAKIKEEEKEMELLAREKRAQQAVIGIKKKFGKNAIVKGMNLEEGATAIERNGQVGGHKA